MLTGCSRRCGGGLFRGVIRDQGMPKLTVECTDGDVRRLEAYCRIFGLHTPSDAVRHMVASWKEPPEFPGGVRSTVRATPDEQS